jgi:Family of unknown function (DUF6599)
MLRRLLILASFCLLADLPAAAQGLLPASFSGWNSTSTVTVQPSDLEKLAGNNAAVLREYGVALAEQRDFTRGARTITLTLYRIKDSSAAYGAYSFLRTPDMTGANLIEHSSVGRDRALLLIGNLILDATAKDIFSIGEDLSSLAQQLALRAEQGSLPPLPLYLPVKGRVPRSDRYVLGPVALSALLPLASDDWLGFADGAEAELARYRINGEEYTLLITEYPTPQIANKQLRDLAQRFDLDMGQGPAASDTKNKPTLFARQTSSLVAFVVNAHSKAAAEALLSRVRYETDLTWNEPSFSLTQPGWGTIIVGIITGTGILCLFALIAGIAFGGVRVLVKRFFPGKVFDRASQVEILQLGLTSKPIEAKDLY